jgi:hypothetical protein
MRGYPIIFGEGVDPDAYQYFLRAGIASGTQTPTAYDNAASFNGTNQFLSTPLTGVNTSQPWSFSCWANVSSSTGYILGKGTDSNGNFGPCISALGFRMSTDGTWGANIREISFGSSFSLNRWTHLAMTWNATDGMRGYVNGVQVGAVAAPTCFNSASEFTIGRYTSFVTAAISSVGAWSKALTASEVSQLWNNGAGRTYASLDSGLRNNLISWWALNGTSSAVSLTDSAPTGNNLTNNGTVTAPNIGPIVTTTQNSRQLINNFVRGIKSLGLWNSMVCWPLRASQNASTTLTARSLGGLGTFDAPMTGLGTASAAWGTNGVNISGSGYLAPSSTPLTASNSVRSQLAVWNNTGGGTVIPLSSSGLPPVRFALRSNSRTTASLDVWDGSGGDFFGNQSVPSGFNQSAATYNHATGLLTFNANQGSQTTATRTITFSSGNITLGSWDTGFFTNNSFLLAFALIANVEMSRDTLNAVNNLYRQTLGIGLNLP